MLKIDSLADFPNREYVLSRLTEEASAGFKLREITGEEYDTYMALRNKMNKVYGISEPDSTKAVAAYISAKPQLAERCTVNNKLTTSSIILRSIKDSEFINDLLSYRELRRLVRSKDKVLLYPKIKLGSTNRITYYEPNIVAYNKSQFTSCSADEYLIFADIRNQEPLIWAEMLGLTVFKPFLEVRGGFYAALFRHLYRRDYDIEELKVFKRMFLSVMYGVDIEKLSGGTLSVLPLIDLLEEAGVKKALNKLKSSAYTKSKSCTTYFGTKLYPNAKSKGKISTAINMPIQGTAADIMFILLENCYKALDEGVYSDLIHIYFTRYDEIVFRVSKSIAEDEAVAYIWELTEHQVDDWVPFQVNITPKMY